METGPDRWQNRTMSGVSVTLHPDHPTIPGRDRASHPHQTPIDLEPVLEATRRALDEARIAPGSYRRWLGSAADHHGEGEIPNPYGCADAANILYSLRSLPAAPAERSEWISALQNFQEAESGLFREDTHHPYHVTAHCAAALELFEARPRHRLRALEFLDDPFALESFLAGLDWVGDPWNASHQGAGIYAARVLCGEASLEWQDRYFAWLWGEVDAETGFWRRGSLDGPEGQPLFHHLAGTFHYLFNHEHARRPLRYSEALIDSCLRLRTEGLWPPLGVSVGFSEVDWVYCLTRALRQSGHRFREVRDQLRNFAIGFAGFLLDRVARQATPFEDLHALFGAICALAELQAALPGLYRTEQPLRLVLDRRPFI